MSGENRTEINAKRKRFEDLVFNRHFISTIKHTGLGGP